MITEKMIPGAVSEIQRTSERKRARLLGEYLRNPAAPERPSYLDAHDVIGSHEARSLMELSLDGRPLPGVASHRAFTRDMIPGSGLDGRPGSLAEITIGAAASALGTRGDLQVAAGFISAMVASADDLLDREGSYHRLGGRLLYLSHAYRDLADMALAGSLSEGSITEEELHTIRVRLHGVITTLAGSERAPTADSYLYEKSCGDRVVEVLLPTSGAAPEIKRRFKEAAVYIGEAGQLIDDVIDYEYDSSAGKRNYIMMKGLSRQAALRLADGKIGRAASTLGESATGPLKWIIETMKGITGRLGEEIERSGRAPGNLLLLSAPLRSLAGGSAGTFLAWF